MADNIIISGLRVGQGLDVHPFATGRKLVLGGVEIKSDFGLEGHSDADVLTHALIDSILGALGLPDIGFYFPNTDQKWKDASSISMLEAITKSDQITGKTRFTILNTDITLLAEKPKISPYVAEIKSNIANALGVEGSQVGIKATTTERLGFVGREEGILASAVTLLMIKV